MTETEQERAAVVAGRREWRAREVALAVFVALSLSQIGYQLGNIGKAIRRDTDVRLCLRLWELGGDTDACKRMRGEHLKERQP